ncbi:hypothetical protein EMPS_07286 [Entomortierella parvispora]|uniref:Uncharacterized protein n=1 Tax=Entomortierella parvispora TaxID=205924 RepID=A0A9P3HEM5_9FUNG|nr:hypothetical protein EMPS_07286 [Entomortierella parvispora]
MRSFTLAAIVAALALSTVSAQQPETPLPCYQASCSNLISVLQECSITVDASTGNINFPVASNTTSTTDKCLCKQSIVDAYDPCYNCGAENQKIQNRFSTQNLVDSCNLNFGASTVKMPGSSAGAASSIPSMALAAASVMVSLLVLA